MTSCFYSLQYFSYFTSGNTYRKSETRFLYHFHVLITTQLLLGLNSHLPPPVVILIAHSSYIVIPYTVLQKLPVFVECSKITLGYMNIQRVLFKFSFGKLACEVPLVQSPTRWAGRGISPSSDVTCVYQSIWNNSSQVALSYAISRLAYRLI